MEQAMEILRQYVPEVILSALTVVCYVLYIIVNLKTGKKGKVLQTLVKEKVTEVNEGKKGTDNELVKANKRIDELMLKIERIEKHQEKTDRAIISMAEEDI